jgi:hypothetical protein
MRDAAHEDHLAHALLKALDGTGMAHRWRITR